MSVIDIEGVATRPKIYARDVLSNCPDCAGELTVLRVIAGRAGCEYWALSCTDCGGIHLDILETRLEGDDEDPQPAA